MTEDLRRALNADPVLARRWAGDTAGLADSSRSALAFALGAGLKRAGFGYAEMCALLRRNMEIGGGPIAAWLEEREGRPVAGAEA